MSGPVVRRALRRSGAQIRHVRPVSPRAAQGLVAGVYAQVERDFGMLAPPISLHSPAPGPLAAAWLMLRETLLVTGQADRSAKEAVATVVSLGNTCPYCVDVHGATLHGLAYRDDSARIITGRLDSVRDEGVRQAAAWARARAGEQPVGPGPGPLPAGYGTELAAVAVTFEYLNRMVNIFLEDSPLPAQVPATARGRLMHLLGWIMGRTARKPIEPGAALALLPEAPLPADLSWAAANARIAAAFARSAAAIELAGRDAVPASVSDLVLAELGRWHGQPLGPGRDWLDQAVRGLEPASRPAARLALATAFASYQVTRADIDAVRLAQPDDEHLIQITSWASLAAARRASRWIAASC